MVYKLAPVFFIGGFANPVAKQPVAIDVYGGDVLEYETEVFDHKVFPSYLWSSSLSFVVTAGSDHVAGWPVWGVLDHFPNEISLLCCNHVSDAGDRIEHCVIFFIPYPVFVDC